MAFSPIASTSRLLAQCTCRVPKQTFSSSPSSSATPLRSFLGLTPPAALPLPSPDHADPTSQTASKTKRSSFLSFAKLFGRHPDGRRAASDWLAETHRRKRDTDTARALEKAFTLKGAGSGWNNNGGVVEMRCTTLNENGDITTANGSYAKTELCTRYGIQPRDLRKLDSAVPTVVPTILVRRAAILLTMLHLRVVITAKEVTLFDSVGSEDSWLKGVFVWHLEHALKATTKTSHGLPYEFRALESCLLSVTTALETEMTNLRDLVTHLLEGLEEHIDRDKLRLLLQYSRKLTSFQKRAKLVQECLEEVLENDEDLAAMYLTAKLDGSPRDAHEHEEIELLLESFSKQCEEIFSEVENLSANVRHTEDIIELILDANRNSLLGLDLKVSICTLGLTSGALIAGLFGMNLSTRLEEHAYAFPLITLSAFAFAGFVTVFGLRRLRKLRKVQLGVPALEGRGGTTTFGGLVGRGGGGEGGALRSLGEYGRGRGGAKGRRW